MAEAHLDQAFSPAATILLTSLLDSAPYIDVEPIVEASQIVRYLAGRSSSDEVSLVESAAVSNVGVRRQLGRILAELDRFQAIPYRDLVLLSDGSESYNDFLSDWIKILEDHVETVSANFVGQVPTTWQALARMAKQGVEGYASARTIWRALFFNPSVKPGSAPLQLGFGYRRLTRGAVETAQLFTQLKGFSREDGALEIEATTELGPLDHAVFFAYSVNGRALPLAEATITQGKASVVVEGLGEFLRLPVGPIPSQSLSAKFEDWPENSKLGQIVVQSGGAAVPVLQEPVVENGTLTLNALFDDPRMDGRWQLLLAATPNSWQLLAQFDIKSVIERPQALTATMPRTAKEGPFGGALLLRMSEADTN